ncbi:MAG: hypothetical protein KGH75_00430 [Rhodospirillales bacterium]|nr:hypothetical protein [Rhodospirillales bacterium]
MNETVMVRSRDAGVHFGELVAQDRDIVTLRNPRRCWYWNGAATLSELATEGTSDPKGCKFPAPTEGEHQILGVCEVLPVTARAMESLDAVPVWTSR